MSGEKVIMQKIKGVAPFNDGKQLTFEDEAHAPIVVSQEWAETNNPQVGGYYVVYQDGSTAYVSEEEM